MPELPEVEITARLIGEATAGAEIESAFAPGLNTLKSFDPPLEALAGDRVAGIGRRGKNILLSTEGGLTVLIHLMSAGRFQLHEKRASMKDKTARLLIRLADGREVRLREFGTRQRAWAKLLPTGEVEADEAIAKLGPEAWPDPPLLADVLEGTRPLYTVLRDQRVIAGIGRQWVDEILWTARLSPFKRGSDLSQEEAERLRQATIDRLGGAISHYEETLSLPLPDKLPLPLEVHHREGEECPRCGATIHAVHYQDYVMCYCPEEQTEGRILKDRRLSRLLK